MGSLTEHKRYALLFLVQVLLQAWWGCLLSEGGIPATSAAWGLGRDEWTLAFLQSQHEFLQRRQDRELGRKLKNSFSWPTTACSFKGFC